jgi:hypothetical protein
MILAFVILEHDERRSGLLNAPVVWDMTTIEQRDSPLKSKHTT